MINLFIDLGLEIGSLRFFIFIIVNFFLLLKYSDSDDDDSSVWLFVVFVFNWIFLLWDFWE